MSDRVTRERISIDGPVGRLDGELAYRDAPTVAALIVNPHPYMGGTMRNLLVEAMADGLARAGAATVRFDYRGVGASGGDRIDVAEGMSAFWTTGHAPFDDDLAGDAAAAMAWLRESVDVPLVLVGYSFGAYLTSKIVDEHVAGVSLIAPTITTHALRSDWPESTRLQVIYSDNDFATPITVTARWIDTLPELADELCVTGGEHFFKGCEGVIADRVARHLVPGRQEAVACF